MLRYGARHQSRRLSVLDELSEVARAGLAPARRAGRLLDRGETAFEYARTGHFFVVHLELRPQPRERIHFVAGEKLECRLGILGTEKFGMLQRAGQIQIVRRLAGHCDAHTVTIDVGHGFERRARGHQVRCLDFHVRRGESDFIRALGFDGEKPDLPLAFTRRLGECSGAFIRHDLNRHAEPFAQLVPEVERDAAGRARDRVARGQQDIGKIDADMQLALGREIGTRGGNVFAHDNGNPEMSECVTVTHRAVTRRRPGNASPGAYAGAADSAPRRLHA